MGGFRGSNANNAQLLRHFSVRRQSIGYKTVAIRSKRLKIGDHNAEDSHDTHTQNQVNL